jgi:hypothetical protein
LAVGDPNAETFGSHSGLKVVRTPALELVSCGKMCGKSGILLRL